MTAWHHQIRDIVHTWDPRHITFVYSKSGFADKPRLLASLGDAVHEVPRTQNPKSLMRFVMDHEVRGAYILELSGPATTQMYATIESLKDGRAYTLGRTFESKRFDRPRVIVLADFIPYWTRTNWQRWDTYELQPDHSLAHLEKEFEFVYS